MRTLWPVLLGGLWIGLAIWSTGRAESYLTAGAAGLGVGGGIALAVGLWLALLGLGAFFRRTDPASLVPPLVIVAMVWAGLVVECDSRPIEAWALAMVVAAWVGLAYGVWADEVVGILIGLGVGACPLLVGSAVGLGLVRWDGDRAAPRRGLVGVQSRVMVGFVTGAILGVAAALLLGRPFWNWMQPSAAFSNLGPATAWRLVAWRLDLAMAAVVLGALGVVAGRPWSDEGGFDGPAGDGARLHRGLCVWLGCNVVLGLVMPGFCADYGLVMLAPAGLLAALGWAALRSLVVPRTSMATVLPGAVGVLLLAVLLWAPLRSVGRIVWVAMVPP
ncbi:MAG: hypothetical protein GY778_30640 [bacterium]|nr:hypothetical protein [bacterium]